MSAAPERRRHTRGKRLLRFEFTLGGGSVRALSSNVSAGGAFLCATELPRTGTEVTVRFAAGSDGRRYVTIRALVLRTVEEASAIEPNRGFAVRWLEASVPGHPDHLEEFLSQFKEDAGGQILVPDERDPEGRYRYLFPPPEPEAPEERRGTGPIALGSGPVDAPPAETLSLSDFLSGDDDLDDDDDGPPTTPVGAPPDAALEALFGDDSEDGPLPLDLAELEELPLSLVDTDLELPLPVGARARSAPPDDDGPPVAREPQPAPEPAWLRPTRGGPARVEPTVRRAAPGPPAGAPAPAPVPAHGPSPAAPPAAAAAPGPPLPAAGARPTRPPGEAARYPSGTGAALERSGSWPAASRGGESGNGAEGEPSDEDIGSGLVPFETPVFLEWSGQSLAGRTTHLTETQLRVTVTGGMPPVYGRVAVLFPSGRKNKPECVLRANVTRLRRSATGDGGLVTLRLALQNEPSDVKAYRKIVKKAGG